MTQNKNKTLLVARESSTGTEAQLLLNLLFQTIAKGLAKHSVQLPDFRDVVELFQSPHGPSATSFRKSGMKAVLVTGDECDVLLSLGSARKLNDKGDNAFVDVLVQVLETGAYDQVITTSISRLCRNTVVAGKLEHALGKNRVRVLLGDQEIEVWEPMGKLLWVILVWFAQFEAQQIEARLLAGKAARAQTGEWVFGYAPPPGWRLKENGQLEVDSESAEAVRWLIQQVLAGRSNFTELARQTLHRWPNLTGRRGGALLSDQENPGAHLRRSWLSEPWLPVYYGEPYRVTFVPHAEKENPGSEVNDPIAKIEFVLPPQPTPIATRAEIERLSACLDRLAATAPKTRPGGAVGSCVAVAEADVEIDDILITDPSSEGMAA